jgi:hypothetical protein
MARAGALITAFLAAALLFAQANPAGSGVPVSTIVSVETPKNTPAPHLTANDVIVTEGKQHLPVSSIVPVQDRGGLQLWILIDDGTQPDVSLQYPDLRKFMLEQPSSTQIGLGYIRNGMIQVAQPLGPDHQASAKALRLPMGPPGIAVSPYIALSDLLHHWPATGAAREVLMISSGVDPENGPGPVDPYLDEALDACQRGDVIVYSIYYAGMGHFGHARWQIYWGQYNLSKINDETGGEFYWEGFINPVSFSPFLDDLNHRLNNQYILTYVPKPQNKAGFQNIKFATELSKVSLVGPAKVYVPASQ